MIEYEFTVEVLPRHVREAADLIEAQPTLAKSSYCDNIDDVPCYCALGAVSRQLFCDDDNLEAGEHVPLIEDHVGDCMWESPGHYTCSVEVDFTDFARAVVATTRQTSLARSRGAVMTLGKDAYDRLTYFNDAAHRQKYEVVRKLRRIADVMEGDIYRQVIATEMEPS